jgi:hypothetical protein
MPGSFWFTVLLLSVIPTFLVALLAVGWRLSGGKVRACLKALEAILRQQTESDEAGESRRSITGRSFPGRELPGAGRRETQGLRLSREPGRRPRSRKPDFHKSSAGPDPLFCSALGVEATSTASGGT